MSSVDVAEGRSGPPGQGAGVPVAASARALTRRFGDRTAVDGVDLDIPQGSTFGLLGPDGAGKTTFIRMLATVLAPGSGEARVFGHDVVRERGRVTPRIGYMPQRFSMYPDLSVAENIDYFATLRGVGRRDRATRSVALLESMGMAEFGDRRAGALSGGMKQKLMLATTLMHEPDLLLLDEPTTGVDPVSRREFWRILADQHALGRTILVATPYMDEAERCTDIAFLREGRILTHGTLAEVAGQVPGTLLEVGGLAPRQGLAALTGDPGVLSAHVHGDVVRVLVAPGMGARAPQTRGADAADTAVAYVLARLADAGLPQARANVVRVDMEAAFALLAGGEAA